MKRREHIQLCQHVEFSHIHHKEKYQEQINLATELSEPFVTSQKDKVPSAHLGTHSEMWCWQKEQRIVFSHFSNVHRQARETNSKQWFFFFLPFLSPSYLLGNKLERPNHQFYTENTADHIRISFTWSFKDRTRRKRSGPHMVDGNSRERSQH